MAPLRGSSVKDLEIFVERSVGDKPRDLVVSTEEGKFLILVIPLDGFDHHWKKTFLEWLKNGRSIRMAAHLAGVARSQLYRHREADETFRNAWDLILKKREAQKSRNRRRRKR